MFSKFSKRPAPFAAVAITAGFLVGSLVAPAVGAPSALSIAKKALKISKKANKRSKLALAEAKKPGPPGPTGPTGEKGDRGPQGPGAVRIDKTVPVTSSCTNGLVYDGAEFDLTACAHASGPHECRVFVKNNTSSALSASGQVSAKELGPSMTEVSIPAAGEVKVVEDRSTVAIDDTVAAETTLLIRSPGRTYSIPLHLASATTTGPCALFAQVIPSP